MLYRVLRRLSTGHERGDIVPEQRFKPNVLEALVNVNALSPISTPPLSELQGWAGRAELLAEVGIFDALQFVEADDKVLREVFGYKTDRRIKQMKDEVWEALQPGVAAGRRFRP